MVLYGVLYGNISSGVAWYAFAEDPGISGSIPCVHGRRQSLDRQG